MIKRSESLITGNEAEERALIELAMRDQDAMRLERVLISPMITNEDLSNILHNSLYGAMHVTNYAETPSYLLEEICNYKNVYDRGQGLNHPNMTLELVKTFVLTGRYSDGVKLSRDDFALLSLSPHICQDFELFEKLWERKSIRTGLIYGADMVASYVTQVDSKIVDFLAANIREEKNVLQLQYANSGVFAIPVILDSMKSGPTHEIALAVAYNPNSWDSTREYLFEHYSSEYMRRNLASSSKDNEFLNRIYRSTVSKLVLEALSKNPHFVKL